MIYELCCVHTGAVGAAVSGGISGGFSLSSVGMRTFQQMIALHSWQTAYYYFRCGN